MAFAGVKNATSWKCLSKETPLESDCIGEITNRKYLSHHLVCGAFLQGQYILSALRSPKIATLSGHYFKAHGQDSTHCVINCRTQCTVPSGPVIVRDPVEIVVEGSLGLFIYNPEDLADSSNPYRLYLVNKDYFE